MRTIDDVLNEAAEGLKAHGARTMPDRDPTPTRRLTFKPSVAMPVAALIVLIVFGIPALLLGTSPNAPTETASNAPSESVPTPTPTNSTNSTATTVTVPQEPADGGPAVLNVSKLSASDPQVPEWPDKLHQVDETLAATGIAYDTDPDDYLPDAAVKDGRAVIVGGNEERTAGIWYSDDGTWNEVTLNLPSGMSIGESDGDYRLADGIQNVEAFSGGFLAWEPVQLVEGDEPDSTGTLLLSSLHGSEWEANVYGARNTWFTDFGEYADGYLATVSTYEEGRYTTKLVWASDLWSDNPIDWSPLGTIGEGFAHELAIEGSTVYILMEASEGDGSPYVTKVDLG